MVVLPLKHHSKRAGAPNLRKEGGSLRNEKRAPVVLERWFGSKVPRSDCSSPAEERREPETSPGREEEDGKERR